MGMESANATLAPSILMSVVETIGERKRTFKYIIYLLTGTFVLFGTNFSSI